MKQLLQRVFLQPGPDHAEPAGDCRRAPADNAACECAYYVRLPAAFAAELDAESVSYEGSTARVITKPMSVKAMHELAKRLRKGGAELFFAELG